MCHNNVYYVQNFAIGENWNLDQQLLNSYNVSSLHSVPASAAVSYTNSVEVTLMHYDI